MEKAEMATDTNLPLVKLTRQDYATAISTAWHKAAESIIETGRLLIAAKASLDHGEWLPMIRNDLPFSEDIAQRLMTVAKNPILSNTEHVRYLPPHWATLHALAKLPDNTLLAKMQDGSITPNLERREVAEWYVPKGKGKGKSKSNSKGSGTSKGKKTKPRAIVPRNNYILFIKSMLLEER